jgi:hypothetical protein
MQNTVCSKVSAVESTVARCHVNAEEHYMQKKFLLLKAEKPEAIKCRTLYAEKFLLLRAQ